MVYVFSLYARVSLITQDSISWLVRAPTGAEVSAAVKRVTACFEYVYPPDVRSHYLIISEELQG